MHVSQVIKSPVLTEKTYRQMAEQIYTFAVDSRTNKAEVKRAVEFIFNVKVKQVNIIKIDRKPKKMGRFAGFKPGYKKAIVTLKEGSIAIFPEDKDAQSTTPTAAIDENVAPDQSKTPASDVEARAAAKIAQKKQADVEAAEPSKPALTEPSETKETDEKVKSADQATKKPGQGGQDGA